MTDGSPETAEPAKLRVLVATPVHGDMVKRGYAWSVTRSIAHFLRSKANVEKDADYTIVWSSNLAENRHRLVSRAFEWEATHLLFWDSDVKAQEDCIVKLLNHNVPVVAANYPTKEVESRPTAYIDDENYIGPCWTQEQHSGLQEISSCGFGLMLIDMRVFEKLSLPFFQFTPQAPDFIKTETEDVFFCRKVRELGLPIYIDHDVSQNIAHIGDWEYTNRLSDMAQQAKQALYRDMPTSGPEVPL